MQKKQESCHFKCDKCKDTGFTTEWQKINNIDYLMPTRCKCKEVDEITNNKDRSGLGDLIKSKTLDNYYTKHPYQKGIKDKAQAYLEEFKKGNRYWFALLGQSGIGKTHIMAAVSGQLLKMGHVVKYYTADDIIQKLQSCKFNEEDYNKQFGRIAEVEVLYIDELFKSSIQNFYNKESFNSNDFREIFKIINYRYNKNKPMLINSEIHFERFGELDQAMIGRINEKCKKEFIVSVKPDKSKNYRLYG